MRRLMVMLGMAVLLACMAAGVAVAAERFNEKDCNNVPCNGTDGDDLLHEQQGTVRDVIYGEGGNDVLDANNFSNDEDRLFGGDNGDKILANDRDGRDVVRGGDGRDLCYIDRGDRTVNCEEVRKTTVTGARADFESQAFLD